MQLDKANAVLLTRREESGRLAGKKSRVVSLGEGGVNGICRRIYSWGFSHVGLDCTNEEVVKMATRKVRRGFARREKKREEGEVRNATYRALPLYIRIELQEEARHNGRQLTKLRAERDAT